MNYNIKRHRVVGKFMNGRKDKLSKRFMQTMNRLE